MSREDRLTTKRRKRATREDDKPHFTPLFYSEGARKEESDTFWR